MTAFALAAVTPRSLEELISRLPARERAEVRWAPVALAESLDRLLGQSLTQDLLGQTTAAFLGMQQAIATALGVLSKADKQDLQAIIRAQLEQHAQKLLTLPLEIRRPSFRALCTAAVLGGIGIQLLSSIHTETLMDEISRLEPGHEGLGGVRLSLLVAAILRSLEQRSDVSASKIGELARRADDEAGKLAGLLAAAEPKILLPWYFESAPNARDVAPWAAWAEERVSRNDAALALLEAWSREDAGDQPHEWEQIQRSLDENRTSDRPLFP